MADETETQRMTRLIRTRGGTRAIATRRMNRLDEILAQELTTETKLELAALCDVFKKLRQTLDDMNSDVQGLIGVDEIDADMMSSNDYDVKLAVAIQQVNSRLAKVETATPRTSTASTTGGNQDARLKLPKLDIPKFDGSYSQWVSFSDLFDGAVHANPNLTGSQKLFYLKGLLTGEAKRLLTYITITDANYEEARDILKNRYQNLKAIVREHIAAIVNAPNVNKQETGSLRNLAQTIDEHRRALEALGQNTAEMDIFIVYHVVEKMDHESRRQWELEHPGTDILKYDDLNKFLTTRCRALEAAQASKQSNKGIDFGQAQNGGKRNHSLSVTQTNKCPQCKQAHGLFACDEFKKKTVDNRRKFVRDEGLCFNCLRSGHTTKDCSSTKKCKLCNKSHNTMLHINQNNVAASVASDETSKTNTCTQIATAMGSSYQVLLQTANIQVLNKQGRPIFCRALLYSGSHINLMTNACRAKLGLALENSDSSFTVAGTGQIAPSGKCKIQLPIKDSIITTPALVVKGGLTMPLPSVEFDRPIDLPKLPLADSKFNIPSEIDILIGAELYESLRTGKTIKHGDLLFTSTAFGYVVSGPIKTKSKGSPIVNHIMTQDDCLQNFWETEEIPFSPENTWTKEERECSKHYDETTTRQSDGRFVVEMPFKKPTPAFGDSFKQARLRFEAQERRLQRNPGVKEQYKAFIKEFEDMGHLEEVPPDELDNGCENHYYLPHHAVFKESSATTKLRVVFDGSAKTSSGVSLNDILMIGPVLQPNIFDLLIRFRLYKFGLTADVAKMYRQTALAKKARRFHRLLWRDNPKDEFRHLQLRVIYGIASSGYHAVRSLQETAKLTENENVRTAIFEGFYVDDFLSGCNTLEDAKGLQDELIATLEKAKLPLRKWVSNDQTLVERLPPDMRGGDLVNLFEADSTIRTLGITWQPQKDHFKFTCTLPKINPPVTKRQILSEIAKLFDPIGWLTPITIKAKIWIQRLWTLGLAWDEPLAENLIEEFNADIKGI